VGAVPKVPQHKLKKNNITSKNFDKTWREGIIEGILMLQDRVMCNFWLPGKIMQQNIDTKMQVMYVNRNRVNISGGKRFATSLSSHEPSRAGVITLHTEEGRNVRSSIHPGHNNTYRY
jgi:hypothetical protein